MAKDSKLRDINIKVDIHRRDGDHVYRQKMEDRLKREIRKGHAPDGTAPSRDAFYAFATAKVIEAKEGMDARKIQRIDVNVAGYNDDGDYVGQGGIYFMPKRAG